MMDIFSRLKQHSRAVYIALALVLGICSLLRLVPSAEAWGAWATPPVCLFVGLVYALCCRPAYPSLNKRISKQLLAYSIVGLGFGMNFEAALASGQSGMLFTVASVFGTMLLGYCLAKWVFGVKPSIAYLISAGTAICGGSAIAAVSPLVRGEEEDSSVALGIVFLLNAVALFIFPYLGHCLGLDAEQFGMWAAIAIHDTSSVVGAASTYGEEALRIATLIKLTRALWIVPLALITAWLFRREGQGVSVPWFIVGFVLAMLTNTYLLADYPELGLWLSRVSRQLLSLTMFFIGASLSLESLRRVGIRSLLFALCLWLLISLATLGYILL